MNTAVTEVLLALPDPVECNPEFQFDFHNLNSNIIFQNLEGHLADQFDKAPCYKAEGHGFDLR
jgi:hypothetical protein